MDPFAPQRAPRARRAWRSALLGLCLPALIAGLSGCGESKEEKAMKKVCSARADINTQIEHLKALPLSTESVEQAKTDLSTISADLNKMKDAQSDLAPDRKAEVEKATSEFSSEVQAIVSSATSNLSLSNAQAQLKPAVEKLASSYAKALGPVNCS
jgi:hypothetical protein